MICLKYYIENIRKYSVVCSVIFFLCIGCNSPPPDQTNGRQEIPFNASMAYQIGNDYYLKEAYGKAIKQYKKAIEFYPSYAEAHYNLGYVYFLVDRLDEAIFEMKTAIEIEPRFASAHLNLGRVYVEKGVLDEAESELKSALKISEKFLVAHYYLSEVYEKKHDLVAAERERNLYSELSKRNSPPEPRHLNKLMEIEEAIKPSRGTGKETHLEIQFRNNMREQSRRDKFDEIDVEDAESRMVDLVNLDREREGLRALRIDDRLKDIARKHSQDMLDNNFFAHRSPTHGELKDRFIAAGVIPKKPLGRNLPLSYGENIAIATTIEEGQKNLMNSMHHRENILHRKFTHVGIGIVKQGSSLWITQVFSTKLE